MRTLFENLTMAMLLLAVVAASASRGVSQESNRPESYGEILQTLFEVAPNKSDNPEPNSAKTPKTKKPVPKAVINYDIYRDRNPYPVDPRKPCNDCTKRKGCNCKCCRLSTIPGFQGRPYQEREPGGCLCGKRHSKKHQHPYVDVYWPNSFSGITEQWFPAAAERMANPSRFRISNVFDQFGDFELMNYQRKDNGYCGPGRDRYGCLGESRQFESQVRGVGFREPGQPVNRGFNWPVNR